MGTVYRHFPSLDELIPACDEISMQIVALPDPQGVSSLFDGVDAPAERIERLVLRDQGLGPAEAAGAVSRLLTARLARSA